MRVTNVQMQEDLEESLEELANKLHRSKSWVINEAVKQYIARQETEPEKWGETIEAINSIKKGDVVDGKDVHVWLKSWGKKNEINPPNA